MKKDLTHITQLTKRDLQEIANATNPQSGFLINIEKSSDGLKFSIDPKALALAINGFIRNGGAATNANNCVNISFNPPS